MAVKARRGSGASGAGWKLSDLILYGVVAAILAFVLFGSALERPTTEQPPASPEAVREAVDSGVSELSGRGPGCAHVQ